MRSIGRDPIFVASGAGAELVDVDGNRYVDYVCSWGPLIAGHAHPAVVAAVTDAAARGTSYGAATAGEVLLAEEVVRRIPSAEMIRMTSSGTEASMSAIRLARAATGRDPILKFAGAYHGHVDGLLAEAGSGLATQGIPASPGRDGGAGSRHRGSGVERPRRRCGGAGGAAARGDPGRALPGKHGAGAACEDGFLQFLREAADESGALLVFDEVISGFRVGRGGAQGVEGVLPDLTVLGKVIGGGLPAAAFAGSRELMERIAPAGDVYQAGTLSGNPLAVAAGLATLALLDDAAYEQLSRTTSALAAGLADAAAEAGVAVQVPHVTGLLTVFFSDRPVNNYADAQACDMDAYAAFCRAMLELGVYPPASQYEAWFPSLAHTDEHVERTVAAAREAFGRIGG